MNTMCEQLLTSAMSLPISERLELAEALLAGSETPELTGDAWVAELNRRSAEVDSGEAITSSWPEVQSRVRAIFHQQTTFNS